MVKTFAVVVAKICDTPDVDSNEIRDDLPVFTVDVWLLETSYPGLELLGDLHMTYGLTPHVVQCDTCTSTVLLAIIVLDTHRRDFPMLSFRSWWPIFTYFSRERFWPQLHVVGI